MYPLPFLGAATTDGRGGMSSLKSGHLFAGSSKVETLSNPENSFVPPVEGCCTAKKTLSASGVKQGPHISAPAETLKNKVDVPWASPSVSTA